MVVTETLAIVAGHRAGVEISSDPSLDGPEGRDSGDISDWESLGAAGL
jgi:hypothetical protein